jgi:LacI family transcriptional regulator
MAVVSLKNVAESSGVSIATVSQVLNGGQRKSNIRVSDATRQKVLQIARQLNYHPNIMARGLRGGKTQTAGIIFSLKGPHSPSELVQMIARRVHTRNYVTQVSDSLCETKVVRRVLRDYIRRGVEAVVIQMTPSMHKQYEDLFPAFKAVVLITSFTTDTTADQVILTREQAIYDVVDHLLDTGRKRPMILAPPSPREEKIAPFLHRLQERGITYENEPTIFHRPKPAVSNLAAVAWDALETHYPSSVPFDALLCGTDETAVAAYKWLEQRGKKVPDDVAVVGFNNSTYAEFLSPALASIDRQNEDVARLVEKKMFDRLDHPGLAPQQTEIQMKFVPRESAG